MKEFDKIKPKNILILGAGISGLGAAKRCKELGYNPIVLEKDETFGGLCGSFNINGFTFDRFVHLSFAKNEQVIDIFNRSAGSVITHIPNPFNLYKNKWIKHPAQNNLYPLDEDEKKIIIDDFIKRPHVPEKINNYEEWLRYQFGNYFAENFPMVYTKKYWMHEARDLRTEWVGTRLYQPSVEEVIEGSKSAETPVTYYAKEMRYPEKGGYKSFLKDLVSNIEIHYNERVVEIDLNLKILKTNNGNNYDYDLIYSSIPLPEIAKMLTPIDPKVTEAAKLLKATSGYHISVGLKGKNIPPYLWWYIYDEDILTCRVYSPSLKSPKNAPDGCSSLQFEIYCAENQYTESELIEGTLEKFIKLNIINREDVLFVNVSFEKYANVIFTEPIYRNREIVKNFLIENSITPIGRFGEWDYLWSDQSFLSGYKISVKNL